MKKTALCEGLTMVLVSTALVAQTRPAGAPAPPDSPVYNAFKALEQQQSYRMRMTLQSSDPRLAQGAAMGMGVGPIETVVRGGTKQVSLHMRLPASDVRGTVDDWEIRSVAQNGRAARLITSSAVPRYLKLSEQAVQMQMAILEQQARMTILQSLAAGPFGLMDAGLNAGRLAMAQVMAQRLVTKEKEFFSWQCVPPEPGQGGAAKAPAQLTDLRVVGDEAVDGMPVTAYEFFVHENDRVYGPVRLLVAKDDGLPVRIEMTDPQARGSMRMEYSDFGKPVEIEIPACLANHS
jgi:hypothetical protein